MKSTVETSEYTLPPSMPYLAEQKGHERGRVVMLFPDNTAIVVGNGEHKAWGHYIGEKIKIGGDGNLYQHEYFEVFHGKITLSN